MDHDTYLSELAELYAAGPAQPREVPRVRFMLDREQSVTRIAECAELSLREFSEQVREFPIPAFGTRAHTSGHFALRTRGAAGWRH